MSKPHKSKHHKHRPIDLSLQLYVADNGGFIIETWTMGMEKIGRYYYPDIEGVLEFLVTTFNKGN